MAKGYFQFYLEEKTKDAIDYINKTTGITKGKVVDIAIAEYSKNHEIEIKEE